MVEVYSLTLTTSPPPPSFLSTPPTRTPSLNLTFNTPPTLTATHLKFSTATTSQYFQPKFPKPAAANHRTSAPKSVPARDRVIDFGKYKGKMLGSLPSSYLKWVSKNLRAGDSVEWARLADEVLADPVYGDRVEWEMAEKVLSGGSTASFYSSSNDAVSELLEISQRFGWDNEDKVGWSKIDFALLGTSKGGRIPRLTGERNVEAGDLKNVRLEDEGEEEEEGGEGKRRARVERARRRREGSTASGGVGMRRRMVGEEEVRVYRKNGDSSGEGNAAVVVPPRPSPFPGRESLLNKVMRNRSPGRSLS